jgi:hypothetical protein
MDGDTRSGAREATGVGRRDAALAPQASSLIEVYARTDLAASLWRDIQPNRLSDRPIRVMVPLMSLWTDFGFRRESL